MHNLTSSLKLNNYLFSTIVSNGQIMSCKVEKWMPKKEDLQITLATVQVLKFCINSIAFDTVTHAHLGENKFHKVMIEAKHCKCVIMGALNPV